MASNFTPRGRSLDQTDTSFAFDGINGTDRSYKQDQAGYTNAFLKTTGTANPAAIATGANYGAGKRVGNASSSPMDFRGAGNPTAEKTKQTIATAAQGHNTAMGGAERRFPADPDRINAGNTGGRKSRTFQK